MKHHLITQFEEQQQRQGIQHPSFRPGDTLKVHYKIEESSKSGDEKKYRIQVFEGVCIRFKKGGAASSFTVRKIGANSVGVERVFPYHSTFIDKIELLAGGRVRRARLYYLRDLRGKAARIKSRRLPADTLMVTRDENAPVAKPKEKKKKKKK